MQWAAEALVVQDGEWVEADARLMVKLPTVGDVAAAHRPISTLALETRVESCWGVKLSRVKLSRFFSLIP